MIAVSYWAKVGLYAKGLLNIGTPPTLLASVLPFFIGLRPNWSTLDLLVLLTVALTVDMVVGATRAYQVGKFQWRRLGIKSSAKATFYVGMVAAVFSLATSLAHTSNAEPVIVYATRDYLVNSLITLCTLVEVRSVVKHCAEAGMRVAEPLDRMLSRIEQRQTAALVEHGDEGEK